MRSIELGDALLPCRLVRHVERSQRALNRVSRKKMYRSMVAHMHARFSDTEQFSHLLRSGLVDGVRQMHFSHRVELGECVVGELLLYASGVQGTERLEPHTLDDLERFEGRRLHLSEFAVWLDLTMLNLEDESRVWN